MSKSTTKWEKEVKKGVLKLPEVANVNTDTGKRKTHNKIVVEYENGHSFPMTYSKSPSCPHALRNLINLVKKNATNDNSPAYMKA